MKRNPSDRGATDPILVIAAIAVSLVLLVSGSFAVGKLIANGKDLNAKDDLHKVAVAETALRAVATETGDGKPGTEWTGVPYESSSKLGSRLNITYDPAARHLLNGTTSGVFGFRNTRPWTTSNGGTYTLVSSATDGPAGVPVTSYMRKQWSTTVTATNALNSGFDLAGSVTAAVVANPGDVWTASAYLRASSTHPDGFISAQFWNSSGAVVGGNSTPISGHVAGPIVNVPAGQWTRVTNTFTVPTGAVRMALYATFARGAGWTAGDTLDGTALLVERGSTLGDYFDGDSSPAKPASKGYVPYLTDSTATALNSDLKPSGGAVGGTDLAKGDIRFTQSDGTRVAVLTDAAGSAWAAVSKSTTGSLFIRTSESSTIAALGGASGTRTVPAGFTLPSTITVADVNTALTNAGGF